MDIQQTKQRVQRIQMQYIALGIICHSLWISSFVGLFYVDMPWNIIFGFLSLVFFNMPTNLKSLGDEEIQQAIQEHKLFMEGRIMDKSQDDRYVGRILVQCAISIMCFLLSIALFALTFYVDMPWNFVTGFFSFFSFLVISIAQEKIEEILQEDE